MKTIKNLESGNSISEKAVDYETAVNYAGHGRFQYFAMGAIGFYYVACSFETFSISYLLPSAECDLQMTSFYKGILNSSPFVGALAGACLWGKLADSWGRRSVVITARYLDAIASLLSCLSQTFWPFLAFRVLTGFTNLAAMPVCFPYLGEMHSSKFRSRALCWMEIYVSLGIVLVPLVAWAIIPREWVIGSAEIGFRFNSWRIFIASCAIPSVLSAIGVSFLPESPAFLLAQGRHDDALNVLRHMYHVNTGDSPSSYPVKRLEMEVPLNGDFKGEGDGGSVKEETRMERVMKSLNQAADLFRPPLLKDTLIGIIGLFSLQVGFYGFGMWFPELFNRFEKFTTAFPNETASICEVANMEMETPAWRLALEDASAAGVLNVSLDCSGDTIQSQVFLKTFSIGFTTICCVLLAGFVLESVGRKRVIVAAMTVTACCGAGTYFVRSALQNLLLSCALQAFNGISFSTLMSVVVELYPASLRGLATTILMNMSYIGSITGNLLFGLLLDVNCAIPVFCSAGLISVCSILCLFLPYTNNNGKMS